MSITIVVTDHHGHERMRRDMTAPIVPPPPGWDHARWTGKLVEDLCRQLESELELERRQELESRDVDFPAYVVCSRCGHYLTAAGPLRRCENCSAGSSWLEYYDDGQDAEDRSEELSSRPHFDSTGRLRNARGRSL